MTAGEATPEKTCFIAMPVRTTEEHQKKFGDPNHWQHVLDELVVPAVETAGFAAWRPIARGSHLIHAEIIRQLIQADMVVIDISQHNPNVFFELGVRTAANKPFALIRCGDEALPFDVSGINTHTYNWDLKVHVVRKEIPLLAEHLIEAESSCNGTNPMWAQFGRELKATEFQVSEPSSSETPVQAELALLRDQVTRMAAAFDDVVAATSSPARHVVVVPDDRDDRLNGTIQEIEAVHRIATQVAEEVNLAVKLKRNRDGVIAYLPHSAHAQESDAFLSRTLGRMKDAGLKGDLLRTTGGPQFNK